MPDTPFSRRLRELKEKRGTTVRAIAARARYSKSHAQDLLTGTRTPTADAARAFDNALNADGELVALASLGESHPPADELDALDLARRVDASDVGDETLRQLRSSFDELATSYSSAAPAELIGRVRHHLVYVARLMAARMTLRQRRELITIGGWLSLLAATLHIDLEEIPAAIARLRTADRLAQHAEHDEIRAWCLETRAWELLTRGDFPSAVGLSQQAQAMAPHGSSAFIQATGQEGRAWARMGERTQTRQALDRLHQLVDGMERPQRPEHHYWYDPAKADAYTATTLAWAGDPAAERYARAVIAQLEAEASTRPRRIAAAQLDLGLALVAANQPDAAASITITAIGSGRIVPSNWWRASEVLTAVEASTITEAADLREVYEAHRPR